MKLEEIQDKPQVDGVTCVVDRCISPVNEDHFKCSGEFCSECDAGFEHVDKKMLEHINLIRMKYGFPKVQ